MPPDFPAYCSPCAPWWLREVLYFPPAGDSSGCCFLLEDGTGTLLDETETTCLAPENC